MNECDDGDNKNANEVSDQVLQNCDPRGRVMEVAITQMMA